MRVLDLAMVKRITTYCRLWGMIMCNFENRNDTVSPPVTYWAGSGEVELNTWTHILFNISGTTATVYLNRMQSLKANIYAIPDLSVQPTTSPSHWLMQINTLMENWTS